MQIIFSFVTEDHISILWNITELVLIWDKNQKCFV
jgi:hypothetical protein